MNKHKFQVIIVVIGTVVLTLNKLLTFLIITFENLENFHIHS